MITKWKELWLDEKGNKSDLVTKHYAYGLIDDKLQKEIVIGNIIDTVFVKITEDSNTITGIYTGKANVLIDQDEKIHFEAFDFVKQDINDYKIDIKVPYWRYL